MSLFARLRSRRATAVAAAALLGIAASTLTQLSVAPERASAANLPLICDNNTLYGVTGAGNLFQIDATTGATIDFGTVLAYGAGSTGMNALGVTRDGSTALSFKNGGNTIVEYDVVTPATTVVTAPDTGGNQAAIRGAVDPVNNIYYYANSGTSSRLAAYDVTSGTEIGQVGTITGLGGSNGDMAFGTDGTLYVIDGKVVYRVSGVPDTAGNVTLAATPIATLPNIGAAPGTAVNSPGIAYSTDGYLYVAAGSTSSNLYRIDPSGGTTNLGAADTLTMTSGGTSLTGVVDLASCNYANSLRGEANIRSRAAAGDQFTITNTGGGISAANTGTTSGASLGLHTAAAEVAGPNLVVGGGSYTVTQTASGTTNLADYSVGWICTNKTTGASFSGSGNTAAFTYPAATTADGSDVVCVFTDAVLPVAVNDTGSTSVNTTLTAPAATGLLVNDTGADIAVSSNTAPSNGSVTVNANGSYNYVPNTDFSGVDTFGYTIADVNGTQVSAIATITVTPLALDDTAATAVNTPVNLTALTGNDHGSVLAIQSVTSPTHGTAVLNGDGSVTYTPNNNYVGSDSFDYTATDSTGQPTTATVTLTVSPDAVDDVVTTPANTPVTTPVLTANDHANSAVTQSITAPSHGAAVLNADGTASYTPSTDYSGTDSFDYTATDTSGASYTGTVQVTVTPTAVDDPATTPAGTPVTVGSLPSNDHATLATVTSITQPTVGSAVLNADGSVTYTPAADFSGSVHIPYTITDSSTQTATADVVITVTPTGLDDAGTTPVNTTLVVPAASGVLANDNGSLSVTSHTAVSHGSVTIAANGSYTYTPTAEYSGPDQFGYVATDSLGQTVTQVVRLTVTPTAADDNAITGVNQPINVPVRSNDHGDLLTITAIGSVTNGSAAVGSGGTIDFTPATDFSGNATVPYTVTDSAGQQVSAIVQIVVNPSAADDSTTTTLNTPVTVSKATLVANDTGTTLDPSSITVQPTNGTAVRNANGSVTYTPNTNYSGPDSFRYQVTDPTGLTATAKVSVIVGNAATPDTGTTPVNTALDVTAANGVLSNDPGTHPLTATIATPPSNGTVTLAADGSYHYVPTVNFSGTDTFQYTATDASANTAVGTVTITVTPTAADDALTVNAGSSATVNAAGVLSNDVGTLLTVVSQTAPINGGSVTLSSDGAYTYTPATGYSGPDSFTYLARDSSGQTVPATVNITVTPIVAAATPTTTVGTPVTVTAANGLLGGASGSGLTAALATPPTHGTVVVNTDGSYTYTPNPGYAGPDTFTFTVTDSSGQTVTGTATVTVQPLALAKNDKVTAKSGQPITIDPLLNDAATGGATFDLATLRFLDPTTGTPVIQATVANVGTWQIVGALFQFTPAPGYVGTASIGYQVTDTAGDVVTATASVVYPQLTTLAQTGTDAGVFDGTLGGGLLALLLGLGLLLLEAQRRRLARTRRTPRHSTAS